MNASERIEAALGAALAHAEGAGHPPRLAAAIRHAVFPGGARIRPHLCLAVAAACGDSDPALSDATAAAIELLHCGSLVHDDLPCFDNAPMRRGRASVHAAFGERLAVLTGDALIVLAFEIIARAGAQSPQRMAAVLATVTASVGMPLGIAAGQAWECEPCVSLREYQRSKTGALFAAATVAGAQAAGSDPRRWRELGESLGEAYQVADDIRDFAADPVVIGKPTGRDVARGRPRAAREAGLIGAIERFDTLVVRALRAIPPCRGAAGFRTLVRMEAERLVPRTLSMAVTASAA